MKIKVGLLSVGLETYWPQFEGLLDNLQLHHKRIKVELTGLNTDVVDLGMVDNSLKARITAQQLKNNQVDILFLYVSTYALSSTVLPIAKESNVPIIILNLQPNSSLDYHAFNALKDRGKMTGIWLENCQACSVPEIASVFNRVGIKYTIITGYLDDPGVWTEIKEWTEAGKVCHSIKMCRVGLIGNYYGGMLDVYTDLTKISAALGTHIEIIEMCELKKNRDDLIKMEVEDKIQEFKNVFNVVPECNELELERAARTSLAMDKLINHHQLDAIAYYYEGVPGNEYENMVTSMIPGNTLLTGKNIPIAGEFEVKNVHAMKIMADFGVGGSFSEFYFIDFDDDVLLLGHDGPAHFSIAEEKVKLVPLPVYHGKPGKGLSIQMSVKKGDITMLSVVEGKDGIFLLVAEGESVEGPVLEIGNTNSRYRFPISVREFINKWSMQGPAHHCAIGVGHVASKIEKLGIFLKLPVIKIC